MSEEMSGHGQRPAQAKAEERAERLSERWEEILEDFSLPCPLCKGVMQAHGVAEKSLYEFAAGEPGVVGALELLLISFVCNRCGYTAVFDAALFNPAYLAQLEGASSERVARLTVRDFRVLVPTRDDEGSETLLALARAMAHTRDGDVLILRVGPNTAGSRQQAADISGPPVRDAVPTLVLRQRSEDLREVIVDTLVRQHCDLLLIQAGGWPGGDNTGVARIIEGALRASLTDIAIMVHDSGLKDVRRVLLATAGGPNARAAAPLVLDIARAFEAELHLLYVASPDDPEGEETGHARITDTLGDLEVDDVATERVIVFDSDPFQAIVSAAADYDMLLLGGSPEDWLGRVRPDNFAIRVTREAEATSLVVLARSNRPKSWLARLLLGTG